MSTNIKHNVSGVLNLSCPILINLNIIFRGAKFILIVQYTISMFKPIFLRSDVHFNCSMFLNYISIHWDKTLKGK